MFRIFERIINERNLKLSDVAKGADIPYSSLTDWKVGRSTPKADKLCKIADFLNVSLDYLVRGKEPSSNQYNLTSFEYALISAYRQQDSLGQSMVDRILGLEAKKKEAISSLLKEA